MSPQQKDPSPEQLQESRLVGVQASSGCSATEAVRALIKNFGSYYEDPINAGLLLNTHYTWSAIIDALRTIFPSQTKKAQDMFTLIKQIFTHWLTAAEMARALAPYYPATDVATVLKRNYPENTGTPADMAGLLLPAYNEAYKPLDVNALAEVLAGLYEVHDVIPVLKSNFPEDLSTGTQIAEVLRIYFATSVQNALELAIQLAAADIAPAETAIIVKNCYPLEVALAADMISIIQTAYASLNIGFAEMASVLASSAYNIVDAAPALKTAYPGDTGSVFDMVQTLIAAYSEYSVTYIDMASALKASEYNIGDIAAVIKEFYPDQVPSAQPMAKLLSGLGFGANETAATLLSNYTAEVSSPQLMIDALAQAPYTALEAAIAVNYIFQISDPMNMYYLLISVYNNITVNEMAFILSRIGTYAMIEVTAVLRNYAAETATVTMMANILIGAYGSIDIRQMASSLAWAGYFASDVAAYLYNDPTYAVDARVPDVMAGIIYSAYRNYLISMQSLLYVMANTGFSAYESFSPVWSLYSESRPMEWGIFLTNAYTSNPLSPVMVAMAVSTISADANSIAEAVITAFSTIPAGHLAVILLIASASYVNDAQQVAQAVKLSNGDIFAGGTAVVNSYPQIYAPELSAVLVSVFTPPNTTVNDLALALCRSYAYVAPGDVAKGIMISFYDTSAEQLADILIYSYGEIGTTLTAAEADIAAAEGFAYVGKA
ncbi:hypothetical protein [Chitinophaga rhizophila]|uniref:Uncharacterized protein n=1 Tax=Chitinophaga rhizophila TaxID=2866212 RepID=A0ABS7GD59_9BACT|nr:hypothetical protein [Chitinophaga rhizophila]MBW8684749.1 hypothetical protein [Chitinophaga rhizophila]